MKIEGTASYQQIAPSNTTPARQAAVERPQAKESGDAFSVTLSATLEKLQAAAPQEQEIRWDKVTEIRDQLAAGSYSITGKDVAAKIVNLLKE